VVTITSEKLASVRVHTETAQWHLQKIVELGEVINQIDLRENEGDELDLEVVKDGNAIANPRIEQQQQTIQRAQQALEVLATRNITSRPGESQ
jgi:dihydroxyacetone kinase-like predicted kinase